MSHYVGRRSSSLRITSNGGSGTVHGWMTESEVLKLQKNGQFPDELVKIDRYKGELGGLLL